MDDKKNTKHENLDKQKKSEIKKGLLKIIGIVLGSGISAVILRVATGSVPVYPVVGSGMGAISAFFVSINKKRK